MNCPICNHTEINEATESCPQCGSDLGVFTHIENAQKEHLFQKKSIIVLAALLGIVVVSWGSVSLFSGDKPKADAAVTEEISPSDDGAMLSSPVASSESALALKKENHDLKSEVASLKSEIKTLKEPASSPTTSAPKEKALTSDVSGESNVIIHTVKQGESLWKISGKYFKNGTKAKKIAEDNNITNVKAIRTGTKLKIYK